MKPSIWSGYGAASYTGKEPIRKRLYRSALQMFGGQLSETQASLADTLSFVIGRMLGAAAHRLEVAEGQRWARSASDLLSEEEREHGIVPDPTWSVWTRRRVLAARKLLPRGNARAELETMLQALLGEVYVGLHITHPDERANWPVDLGDQPMNLQRPTVPRKLIQLAQTISIGLGSPQTVFYTPIDPLPQATGDYFPVLSVGDRLVIEPENLARCEVVTVGAPITQVEISEGVFGEVFRATFVRAHESGCLGTTMPFPIWIGNQRHFTVIVTAAAAGDPETRRRIHEQLERALTSVSTWSIVAETDPGTAGPFILGESPIGWTPFGVVTTP